MVGDDPIHYRITVPSLVTSTAGDWEFMGASWVDLDPLLVPCAHSERRFLRRPRICYRTLEEHMLADLGHTYVTGK